MKRILNKYIIPPLAYALIYLVSMTLRTSEEGKDVERRLEAEGSPIVYIVWHNRLFFFSRYYMKNCKRYKALASASLDGEIFARTLSLFGYGVIRGSSYERAAAALRNLKTEIENGYSVVMVADGSRGPRYSMQNGSLMLAKLTGSKVLPMTVGYSSYWTVSSWDKLMIPKPFAKAVVMYGEPLVVPKNCGAVGLEEARLEMEKRLTNITKTADGYFSAPGRQD